MLFKEITLQTKNIDELYNFYKNTLQLKVVKPNAKTISINAGRTTLIFEQTNTAEKSFYHFAFNIPSNKMEEALQWLKEKVELLWIEDYKNYIAEFTNWNARSVYFLDAAGNIVELIARFDLHDEVDETFSAKHIRNVSEIGIVFNAEQFDARVNELIQQHQLEYFSKQPPMKHFRAIGDDEGLFIVVPEHRNWYPTNIAGGIFALSIVFENDDREYRLQL
jgi:catechol 2,3-dioxygenase-like lactoylglutathione lyase family enzyme